MEKAKAAEERQAQRQQAAPIVARAADDLMLARANAFVPLCMAVAAALDEAQTSGALFNESLGNRKMRALVQALRRAQADGRLDVIPRVV